MEHRGRIQVQGEDLQEEDSRSWARPTPYPADEAKTHVSELEAYCNKSQLARRVQAFKKLRRFIERAHTAGGLNAPYSRTYQNHPKPNDFDDARVDLEVKTGLAFT